MKIIPVPEEFLRKPKEQEKTTEKQEQETIEPGLSPEKSSHPPEESAEEARQQEIIRITESIKETKAKLQKAREELGLPPINEEPPSILSEKERLEKLKAEPREQKVPEALAAEETLQPNIEIPAEKTESIPQSATETNEKTPPLKSIVESLKKTGEKVFDIVKYQGLKIKEHLGRLNQEDFDELLNFDFQQELKDNPPIAGVFSPEEELVKIRTLPKEQRKEALANFKENLAKQRQALASCRVFIERAIEFNNDIELPKLRALLKKFSQDYGFNEKQKEIADSLIIGFKEERWLAESKRKMFPDDYELVKNLTEVDLKNADALEISMGPMSINIKVDGFSAGRIFAHSDQPPTDFRYRGFATASYDKRPISLTVLNRDLLDKGMKYGHKTTRRVLKHEEEHVKNRLFREIFEAQNPKTSIIFFKDYTEESNPEIKKAILEEYFAQRRAGALESVKNEFTATLYSHGLNLATSKWGKGLFAPSAHDSPYDFLSGISEREQNDVLYQEMAQKMLVREYQDIIEKAFDAYAELVKRGKYSVPEAIALLTDQPLTTWPKTVKRLLEQKKAT